MEAQLLNIQGRAIENIIALTAVAMPTTRPKKLMPVDTKRPAAVTGKPLIASCTAPTRRGVGKT